MSGEKDKYDTYPASHGLTVTPFVQETYGRLGPVAEHVLTTLAAGVTEHQKEHP